MTAEHGVAVRLLGGFGVEVDGRVVAPSAWPGRRALELVQLLALEPSRRLVRDRVLDALWPDLGPAAAGANLRKAAHHARAALGDDAAVVLRGGQVALFPERDDVVVDLHHAEASARLALAAGDAVLASSAADAFGEVLPDSPYEEWAQVPRRHAHELRLSLLRLGERWEDVVALEPTAEDAYEHLVRRALDDGLRPAALRWFGRARVALATELGVAPGPVLHALHDEAAAGLVRAGSALVGRDAALARGSAVDDGALLVTGVGGIGKTSLCQALDERWAAAGRAVRWATATGSGEALAPVAALVGELLVGERAALAAVSPHVRSVVDTIATAPAAASVPGAQLSRHEVVGAVAQLLRAVSGGRPSVLVLDDAHLADEATIELAVQLAATVRDVTVVLAARPHPPAPALGRAIDRLRRVQRLTVVDLGPLDGTEARSLAERSSDAPLAPADVDRILEVSAGNPFAIVELARSASVTTAIAPSVGAAVLGRLADVDGSTLEALRRLALADVDLDAVSAIALAGDGDGDGDVDADEVLDRALDAGVLVVDGDRYRFAHDLVRSALADLVPPHRRPAARADAARRLAVAGASPAVVARQWLAAGRPDEAAPSLVAAARRALQLGAFADARDHLAPLLDHEPDHPEGLRLAAAALDLQGDPTVLVAYDRAIAVAGPDEVGDLVAQRALAQVKQGDPAGAITAVAGARPTTVAGRLSQALAYAGAAALGATDPSMGTALAAECRRLALETGDRGAIVIASWAQAAAAHARGELRTSVLADLRDTSDLPDLAVRVFDGHLCITQRLLYGSRPYGDVIAFADRLADEARTLGAARGEAFGATLRGEAQLLSGHLEEAEVDLAAALHLHRSTGGTTGEAHVLQRSAEAALLRGRRDLAVDLLDEALDLARATDIGFHLLDRIYGTRIALAVDPDEALATVEEAERAVRGPLETCPGCRITFAVPAAIACADAGALEHAERHATASAYLAEVVMRLPAWDAAHHEVLAHLASAKGEASTARQHFELAAAGFGAAGQPFDERRCHTSAAAA